MEGTEYKLTAHTLGNKYASNGVKDVIYQSNPRFWYLGRAAFQHVGNSPVQQREQLPSLEKEQLSSLSHMRRHRLLITISILRDMFLLLPTIHRRKRAASPCSTSSLDVTRLRIHDALTAFRGLHELGILLHEAPVVLLGLPVPDAVSREEEVHFFEGALVGFGI